MSTLVRFESLGEMLKFKGQEQQDEVSRYRPLMDTPKRPATDIRLIVYMRLFRGKRYVR